MEHLLSTLQYWQLTRHVLLSMLRPTSRNPSRVGLLASGAPCCSSEAPIFLSSGNSLSLAEPKRPFWHRLQQNTSLWHVCLAVSLTLFRNIGGFVLWPSGKMISISPQEWLYIVMVLNKEPGTPL